MTDHDTRRFTRADDPTLSTEANRLIDAELQAATGLAIGTHPAGAAHDPRPPAAPHSAFIAALIEARLLLGVTFVVVLVAGLVVTLATGAWLVLVGLLALHAVGTIVVALGVVQLASETEHVSPELAARLEAEGVGDPDLMFTNLVADARRSAQRP